MFLSTITRLTVPAFALSGLALLSGCHDKGCSECNSCSDQAPVHQRTVSESDDLQNPDLRTAEIVPSSEGTQFETSYKADQQGDASQSDRFVLRERLATIERERVLYPERAAALDEESTRLRAKLEMTEHSIPTSTNPAPENRDTSSNVRVNDRNAIDHTPIETSVKSQNNSTEPAPAVRQSPEIRPDSSKDVKFNGSSDSGLKSQNNSTEPAVSQNPRTSQSSGDRYKDTSIEKNANAYDSGPAADLNKNSSAEKQAFQTTTEQAKEASVNQGEQSVDKPGSQDQKQ